MPRVLNKHRDIIPIGAIYIGRGSVWGNPYIIGKDGDRETVVGLYRDRLKLIPILMERVEELRGKDLVCFCAPKLCHGDILLPLANS